MIAPFLLTTFQTTTGIPNGADIKLIGKVRPNTYAAMRDYRTLPFLKDLPEAKRSIFTGSVITLDHPQRGMIHVMNFRNGKRSVLDNPGQKNSENGVALSKVLAKFPSNIDIRYAGPSVAGFDVKLPGEEKKLAGFNGTLTAFPTRPGVKGITVTIVNGKVKSSDWLKGPGVHK